MMKELELIRVQIQMAQQTGKQVELIIGERMLSKIIDEINTLISVDIDDTKLRLYGCKVHVDYEHHDTIKLCEVKIII